jgi:hypothetical protein
MPRSTTRLPGQHSKSEAEELLMEELERWREGLGHFLDDAAGGQYSPSRSWTGLRIAHRDGRLLDEMTEWLPGYKGLGANSSATSMTEIVKAGQRTWEHILLEPNQPWTPYVTDTQRQKLLECLRDCYDRAARELKTRVAAQALLKQPLSASEED